MQTSKNASWKLDSSAFLIPIVIFVLLHVARPWWVGFYHDDWTIFVEPSQLSLSDFRSFYLNTFKDRPLLGLILLGVSSLWATNSTWTGHPAFMVVLSSSLVALTALSFYIFLRRVESIARVRTSAPALSVAIWIAIPWGLGYSLWPVSSITTMTAHLLFLSSSILFLDYMMKAGLWRAFAGVGALSASYLIYQSFYLAFVPLIFLLLAFRWQDGTVLRRACYLMIVSSFVQLICVLMALSVTGKSATINIKLILANVGYFLPLALAKSFGYFWLLPLILFLAFLAYGVAILKELVKSERRMFAFALGATLFGVVIGTLPFSAAGYVIQGVGTHSRTTIGANIWICTAVALLLMAGSKSALYSQRVGVISRALLVSLTAASVWQMTNWVHSWDRQSKILSEFPYEFVKTMPEGGVLVLDEPAYINGVEVFAAPWALSSAVYSNPAMAAYFEVKTKPRIVPLYDDVIVSWDGTDTLTLRPDMTVPAKSLWVFTPQKNLLRSVTSNGILSGEKPTGFDK